MTAPVRKSARARLKAVHGRPGFMIRRAHQIALSVFADTLAPLEVTSTQFGVLIILGCMPGIDQITLARLLGLDRSTAAMVVDLLVNRALVARTVHGTDRRKRELLLTKAGKKVVERGEPLAKRARDVLLEPFEADERREFMRLLEKFTRHFNDRVRVRVEQPDTKARRTKKQSPP